jgi:hypothetical protein
MHVQNKIHKMAQTCPNMPKILHETIELKVVTHLYMSTCAT